MIVSSVLRLIVSFLFGRKVKRAARSYEQTYYEGSGRKGSQRQGDVYVSSDTTSGNEKKIVESDMGEYVDFEQVKEE
jgi:hypothetical protein